ncbi:ABC transporter ATP-binding protein/permease [Bifidobacterium subtile]|jgi:ATP-binding cassette subfamily C protein CydD|uniref:CydD, cytochrome D ABC transporter, ATP-binding and permease protein n=1 Tax=Bifidobacterium subtile TaxID=77635 RepID=A0A087EC23_9BIFI|nr:ABC transporter ATP-binding protein/permease [Bifidobacterium subtile]KFJ05324.1 cydD, cytochrome D ABC transporter, ATP-binding and permease protein [Bifidobacterium subtile]QOL36707.1 ABC transporter ATP-binding protein/permease [Bifidobacterium subtile]
MIDKSLFRFPGFRRTIGLLAVLSLAQGASIVAQAYGLTRALVEIWQRHAMASLLLPVAIFGTAFACRQLCEVGKQRVATYYAGGVVDELRPQVQRKVFRLGPAALAKRGTGASVTMLIEGLDQTKTYIRTVLPKMMDMSFIPAIVLIAVWSQSWLSGLVLLLVLPLLFFFMAILGIAARDKSDKQYAEFRALSNTFVDTILGLPTLRMLGVDKEYERTVASASDRFRKRTNSVLRVAMTSTFALDFFTTLAIAIMAVALGNALINGTVVLFPALFSLILAPEYFLPIRQFGDDYHATLNGKNALQDINGLLGTPEPEQDGGLDWPGWGNGSTLKVRGLAFVYEHSVYEHSVHERRAHDANGGATGAKGSDDANDAGGKVSDENNGADEADTGISSNTASVAIATAGAVAASQPGDAHPALHDLSFTLHGFEKVAIIGRSGAGKSTLINMLAGFNIPQQGDIELDGQQRAHFNAPAWQRHISYIPQTPYIFSGSIADNIRFYNQSAGADDVRDAAEQAGLGDWLGMLPYGLDTLIGEGNRGISGGQAQRIALARVIADGSRSILLFDEPTAHLDIETEYELKQTLLPLMHDHLVIFATHRLHWLANVDKVLVLDEGRIVDAGAPTQLLNREGPLRELIDEMGGNQIEGCFNGQRRE